MAEDLEMVARFRLISEDGAAAELAEQMLRRQPRFDLTPTGLYVCFDSAKLDEIWRLLEQVVRVEFCLEPPPNGAGPGEADVALSRGLKELLGTVLIFEPDGPVCVDLEHYDRLRDLFSWETISLTRLVRVLVSEADNWSGLSGVMVRPGVISLTRLNELRLASADSLRVSLLEVDNVGYKGVDSLFQLLERLQVAGILSNSVPV